MLSASDQTTALDAISRWSGVQAMLPMMIVADAEEPGPEADLPRRLR